MKNTYKIIPLSLIVILMACSQKNESGLKENTQSDELQKELSDQNAIIKGDLMILKDIQLSLDTIGRKQKHIYLKVHGEKDLKAFILDEINAEINSINQLMADNHKKIALLNSKLKTEENKELALRQGIIDLNEILWYKQHEFGIMNSMLFGMGKGIVRLSAIKDSLKDENASKEETMLDQNYRLHTAYYVVGTSQELRDENIINKQGGVLGIGTTEGVNGNFIEGKWWTFPYKRIDYTQTSIIPVDCENAELLVKRSPESYHFERDGNKIKNIVITNPEEFWNISKYLVVVKK